MGIQLYAKCTKMIKYLRATIDLARWADVQDRQGKRISLFKSTESQEINALYLSLTNLKQRSTKNRKLIDTTCMDL